MAKIFVDEQGIATPRRPMTLQENYGRMPKMPAGQIPYTGGGQPVGTPSGISRPGIATGTPQATQTPVNLRRMPIPRSQTAPVATRPIAPPAANSVRGFTLGQEGATVSPARPTRPIAQIAHTPTEPLENIDAEVRARINSGSRRFVGPQQPEVMPIATPGKTITFGGRGGAQPVLPGGGIAGALYRNWSQKTGRYIPGLEQAWGGKPTTYREIAGFARGEMQRQNAPAAGQEVRMPLPPRESASHPIAGAPAAPVDAPLHYENMGLGPDDLSRTSTGRTLTPVKPVGITGGDGSGFAVVGGKRINYQDIGTRNDPLSSRRNDGFVSAPDGKTMLLGNVRGYQPIAGDQGARSPVSQPTAQESIVRNIQDIQRELEYITANRGNMYDGDQKIADAKLRIAALQGVNAQLQQGIAGDQTLEGHKYVADAGLAAHRIAGDAQVSAARLAAEGRERTAQAAQEAEGRKQQIETGQADRKHRDDQVRSYLNRYDWGKISPTAANEYAGLLADTDGKGYVTVRDPSGTYGDLLVHQGIEQALRGSYGKIRTAEQFDAWMNQAKKLGAGKAPVYHTRIKNSAQLPLIRSKQDPLLEGTING